MTTVEMDKESRIKQAMSKRARRGHSSQPSSSWSCCSSRASVLQTCPLVLVGKEEGPPPPPSSTGGWDGRGGVNVRTVSCPSGAPGEGHVVACISSEVTSQTTTKAVALHEF